MRYIRKLSKKSNLYKIRDSEAIASVEADILRQELGTKGNMLSFWKFDSDESMKDAIKAILLSTTSIDNSQFIILDDTELDSYGIKRDYSEMGMTGYKGFENLHVNLCNLTYEKLGELMEIIKHNAFCEKFIPELKRDQVKEYITEVKKAGLLNEENIRPELRSAIARYC